MSKAASRQFLLLQQALNLIAVLNGKAEQQADLANIIRADAGSVGQGHYPLRQLLGFRQKQPGMREV